MKIVWASPWNHRSAIASFGSEVVHELARRGHEVEVIRTEDAQQLALPPLPAPGLVAAVRDRDLTTLMRDSDGIVVNMGDHYGFHAGAIPLLHAAPLLVLHDTTLGGFMHGWRNAAGPDAWRIDRMIDFRDLEASICALASGVIVHSGHYRTVAEAACAGPVTTIPLAWAPVDQLPLQHNTAGRLVVTTFGLINANKRTDAVIRAIGASTRLRDSVLYLLVGHVENAERDRLCALADRVGAGTPHFTGWVPDEVLRMILGGTNVVSCLRYPALEGSSASLIHAMLSGRPVLVSDHASYAEVPDDVVLKCLPGDEAAAVLHHLETILDDPATAWLMGHRARAYAQARHAPSAYVDRLLPALDAATRAQPAVRTAIAIGRRLAELGVVKGDPGAERVSVALAGLFGKVGNNIIESFPNE
jgi:glycosyltransferase involved in cell wall biosynthesis